MSDVPNMSASENVAVIDVGSNSIKLLIACAGKTPGSVHTVFVETIETRISAGISRELPSLTDAAMAAGLKTISELAHLAHSYKPKAIRIVATSAVRDALNGLEFVEQVNEATELEVSILSGKEEATLIGKGLACDPKIAGVQQFVQMDIGGGSLELIRFDQSHIANALSLQLGAVRLTERFVENRDAPIDAATEAAIQKQVSDTIQNSHFDFTPTSDLMVVTGGAFTVTRAILAAKSGTTLDNFSPVLTLDQIAALKCELMAMPLHERMSVPHLPASRADIIPTALITIEQVMQLAQRTELTHSLYNLRYGVAAALLASDD